MPADKKAPLEIFLAEDNLADAYLVELALKEHGLEFNLRTVTDGDAAVRAVRSFGPDERCPDIALIDQNLPCKEGDQVMQVLRAHEECSKIPIVIMSSTETRREQLMIERFGAVFFKKPNDLAGFLELGALTKSLVSAKLGD